MIVAKSIIPGEITEFTIVGNCDIGEVVAIIEDRYAGSSKGVLWDLCSGSIANLTQTGIQQIVQAVKTYAVHEKTAFVGTEDLEFGMFRMYETYARMADLPVVLKVFRTKDEALEWLKK